MKTIIKNKSNLNFLNKSVEELGRSVQTDSAPLKRNIELLRLYRDVLKMTQRFTWNNENGKSWR